MNISLYMINVVLYENNELIQVQIYQIVTFTFENAYLFCCSTPALDRLLIKWVWHFVHNFFCVKN